MTGGDSVLEHAGTIMTKDPNRKNVEGLDTDFDKGRIGPRGASMYPAS